MGWFVVSLPNVLSAGNEDGTAANTTWLLEPPCGNLPSLVGILAIVVLAFPGPAWALERWLSQVVFFPFDPFRAGAGTIQSGPGVAISSDIMRSMDWREHLDTMGIFP